MSTTTVVFSHASGPYNEGDVAGLPSHSKMLKRLLRSGRARELTEEEAELRQEEAVIQRGKQVRREKVERVRFTKARGPYNAGDLAGLRAGQARRWIEQGACVAAPLNTAATQAKSKSDPEVRAELVEDARRQEIEAIDWNDLRRIGAEVSDVVGDSAPRKRDELVTYVVEHYATYKEVIR